MNVSVFGLGYVGSITAACLADKGHQVTGIEINPAKLALLQAGQSPLFEPGLADLLVRVHRQNRFTATADAAAAVARTAISFICVGTPSRRSGHPDLTHMERVAREIGAALRAKDDPHIVVVRSTMLPGSIEEVVVPALESASGKREGHDFRVVANPEFMREGAAIKDFVEPPFIVLGERTAGAADPVAELYRDIDAPQQRLSIRAAEAIKFACNAFHAVKITFANEFGQFCRSQGIDSLALMELFCRDRKLNVSPAYLRPGLAYGGSCLPKDLRALVGRARERSLELPLFEAIARSNEQQVQRTIESIAELGHREVGILGLSFKAGTDDLRESPVVAIAEALLGKGHQLAIHDAEVELTKLVGTNKQFLEEKLPHINSLLVPELDHLLATSRTLVVCKKHDDYRGLAARLRPGQIVLDLVGFLQAEPFPPGGYQGLYW
ncbi:nucleotide sugar dehydrogenase [bacterium]|nr:nucleotide sugar dehydrogenase [bacterium]